MIQWAYPCPSQWYGSAYLYMIHKQININPWNPTNLCDLIYSNFRHRWSDDRKSSLHACLVDAHPKRHQRRRMLGRPLQSLQTKAPLGEEQVQASNTSLFILVMAILTLHGFGELECWNAVALHAWVVLGVYCQVWATSTCSDPSLLSILEHLANGSLCKLIHSAVFASLILNYPLWNCRCTLGRDFIVIKRKARLRGQFAPL